MSDGIESQNLRRVMRQNMRDKLPEWPEKPSEDSTAGEWLDYNIGLTRAALARMEALVEYAEHTGAWCSQGMGHACTCGLSELLAACERSVAAQPSGAGRRKS